MEPIVIIIIIVSVINALIKSKKKREQAAKRMQQLEAKRRQDAGDGTSWQPSYTSVEPVQPTVRPTVQAYSPPAEADKSAYFEGSTQTPGSSRMQAPVESRNQAPVTSRNQAPIGTRMQTAGRSNNAPTARSNGPSANPFDVFGELISEIRSEVKSAQVQQAQPVRAQNANPNVNELDPEGTSKWSEQMQSGSLGNPQGEDEGECDDIAHYHSRVDGGSTLAASALASASSSMTDNAKTITSTASPILAPVTRNSMQLNRNDLRRAVIWTEILKRPQVGVPPRMR